MTGKYIISSTGVGTRIGSLSETEYARRLPGHPENIVAVCYKPKYTKSQKKKMAQRPMVQAFVEVNAEASAIMHDPVQKAEWEKRHKAAKREASRHGGYVPAKLWDYIRSELLKAKRAAAKNIEK